MAVNGAADVLADAFRGVIDEAMTEATNAMKDAMADTERRLTKRIDDVEETVTQRIDTTNSNMQAQFAEQEKKIAAIGT